MRNIQIKKYRDSWIKLQHVPAIGYDRPFLANLKRSNVEKMIDKLTDIEIKKSFMRQYYNVAWIPPEFARYENLNHDNQIYMDFRARNYDNCRQIVVARYRLMNKERINVSTESVDDLLRSMRLDDEERELIEKQRELFSKNQLLEEDTGRFRSSLVRTKSRVEELALCNDWQYFCTFTIDKNKNDRYDLDKIIRDFSRMVYELRHEKYSFCENIKYLIVPERHKPSKDYPKGAWHIHGLMSGIPDSRMKFFNKKSKIKKYLKETYIENGQRVGKFLPAEHEFGASTCIEIRDDELSRVRIAKYFVKYVTKDLRRLATEKNRRMFTCSKGLKRADLLYSGSLRLPEYYKFEYSHYYESAVGGNDGILMKIARMKLRFQRPVFFNCPSLSDVLSMIGSYGLRDSGMVSKVEGIYNEECELVRGVSFFRLWYLRQFRRDACMNDISQIFAHINIDFKKLRDRYRHLKFYSYRKRLSWGSRSGFKDRPTGKLGYWKIANIVGDPIYSASIVRSPSELYKLISRDLDFVRNSPYGEFLNSIRDDVKRKREECSELYDKLYGNGQAFVYEGTDLQYVKRKIADFEKSNHIPVFNITDTMTIEEAKKEIEYRSITSSQTYEMNDDLMTQLLSKENNRFIAEMNKGENSFLIKDIRKDGTVLYNDYNKLIQYLQNNKVF